MNDEMIQNLAENFALIVYIVLTTSCTLCGCQRLNIWLIVVMC